MDDSRLFSKEFVVKISRQCYGKGWMNKFSGNISVRVPGSENILITTSCVNKNLLTPPKIIEVDMSGHKKFNQASYSSEELKISSEFPLHASVYKNTSYGAVIHSHPSHLTALALCGKPLESTGCPELIIVFKKIPVSPYYPPGAANAYDGVKELINIGYKVILLENHGALSIGKNLQEAFDLLESAEDIARILYLARSFGLGGEHQLSGDEVDKLYKINK